MKRIIVTIAVAAGLLVGPAVAPAHADASDRAKIATAIGGMFDTLSLADIELYCTMWRTNPAQVYATVAPAFSGHRYWAKDIRAGIHRGSDVQCDIYGY